MITQFEWVALFRNTYLSTDSLKKAKAKLQFI